MTWTFAQLNDKMAIKQKELSLKRSERPELRKQYEDSKRLWKYTRAKIKNLITATDPQLTRDEINDKVDANDEYNVSYAEYIVALSKYDKIKVEIDNLESEMETLVEMGNNLSREAKLLKYE